MKRSDVAANFLFPLAASIPLALLCFGEWLGAIGASLFPLTVALVVGAIIEEEREEERREAWGEAQAAEELRQRNDPKSGGHHG